MDDDGTPGVSASVEAGAKLRPLRTVGPSTMGGGGVLLLLGAGLLVVAGRPKKQRPSRP